MLNFWSDESVFTTKKSAIWIAIIGAKTEPMKYRKSVMLSIGNMIAAAVPIIVTAAAIHFSGSLLQIVLLETPAL